MSAGGCLLPGDVCSGRGVCSGGGGLLLGVVSAPGGLPWGEGVR